MTRVRVYDLATEFRLTTKEVLERLQAAGLEATTFSSSVDGRAARNVLSQPCARIPARPICQGDRAPAFSARPRARDKQAIGEPYAAPSKSRLEKAQAEPSLAISAVNGSYVGLGLDALRNGLAPYVEGELKGHYRSRWWEVGDEASLIDGGRSSLCRVPRICSLSSPRRPTATAAASSASPWAGTWGRPSASIGQALSPQ